VEEQRQQQRRTPDGAPIWFDEPSFGQRLGAAFVDGMLFVGVASLLVRLPLSVGAGRAITTVLLAAYFVGGVVLTGRTLGKRVFGLRIVDVTSGALPGPRAAALRWLVPAAPALIGWVSPEIASYTTWFSFVVYLPILKGPQHRGIHDLVAGTIVTGTATLH
jgi:uncharacterized RDD family membrane protein YckC